MCWNCFLLYEITLPHSPLHYGGKFRLLNRDTNDFSICVIANTDDMAIFAGCQIALP